MKFYSVETNDGEPPIYFATQKEAFEQARKSSGGDGQSDVEELTVAKIDKALLVRLVNVSGGWVDTSRRIATFKNGRKLKEEK